MPEEVTPVKTISWPKVILTVLTIAVIAGAIGGSLFWYFYVRQPTESTPVTTKVATSSSRKAITLTKVADTTDWEVSKRCGDWQVKLPKDWENLSAPDNCPEQFFFSKNRQGMYPQLMIYVEPERTLEAAQKYAPSKYNTMKIHSKDVVEQTITIDGKAARMFTAVSDTKQDEQGHEVAGVLQVATVVSQNGVNVVEIHFYYEGKTRKQDLDDLFLNIISTFKFLP